MKNLKILLVLISLSGSFAEARKWERIYIPGALCGDGQNYSVFLDRKDSDKLLVEFMGGGACWSEGTCYGNSSLANIHPLPGSPDTTYMAMERPGNPWSHHTALYMPYCTGDVFAGFHVASYIPSVFLYHNGYNNVVLTLQYLQQQSIIDFKGLDDVTVWGFSAGAIGALLHAATLEPYLGPQAQKTLIADSPGLHFGKTFWKKFTPELNYDFAVSFSRINLFYSLDDGFLAPHMGPVFLRYHDWALGILQSTKDAVMTVVFGNISPEAHRELVLGPQGIAAIAQGYPNVQTWIAETIMHTFLVRVSSAEFKDLKGETAWDFAVRVHGGVKGNKKPHAFGHGVLTGFEIKNSVETIP